VTTSSVFALRTPVFQVLVWCWRAPYSWVDGWSFCLYCIDNKGHEIWWLPLFPCTKDYQKQCFSWTHAMCKVMVPNSLELYIITYTQNPILKFYSNRDLSSWGRFTKRLEWIWTPFIFAPSSQHRSSKCRKDEAEEKKWTTIANKSCNNRSVRLITRKG
jgi:hypothetical protein